jgi:hypothetical protein
MRKIDKRALRPTPALVVAFVALFAAMGGFGYAAVKMKANSVKTRNLRDAAVTTNKIADGAVTTPKLAPDAVAPKATNAANAMNATNADNAANAMRLGGAAPGECQTGWLKASIVVDTKTVSNATPDAVVPGAFDCASRAADAVTIHRATDNVGRYTITIAGLDSGVAISSSANVGGADANIVTAATKVNAQGKLNLTVWTNRDGVVRQDPNDPNSARLPDAAPPLVDDRTVSLIVF